MAIIDKEFDAFIVSALRAISPYHDKFVLVGGCANALFRRHEYSASSGMGYVLTRDVDIVVPNRELTVEEATIPDLLGSVGITNDHDNYAHRFRATANDPKEIEFLCSLTGMSRKVQDSTPSMVRIQNGLEAEALRYMELLLFEPWQVDIAKAAGFEDSLIVQIPNPCCYMVQKVLCNEAKKSRYKKAKDCFYIYETAVLFRKQHQKLRGIYDKINAHEKWLARFEVAYGKLFGHANAEGLAWIVDVAKENGMDLDLGRVHMIMDNHRKGIWG